MKVGITEMVLKCLNEPKEKYSEVKSFHFSLGNKFFVHCCNVHACFSMF